ncbi:helix-turn-helix domain-containing protein [Tateyamaria sp. SN3-11]|uniref:helix-turn-helix domain-containing protein n=1 Tax=Tateyamaria sp. SN3-11 TaxID=3092147 RepID=UPI0039E84179
MQSEIGVPPAYSEVLYRLYLPMGGPAETTIDGCNITLDQYELLTLSPGERVSFSRSATVLSCAFHHNFFCVRVMRNEVFCDGVVFNRLRGLPIVDLREDGYRTALARFEELGHILEGESLFKPEHAVNTIKSLLLQAADCKIRHANPDESFQVTPAKVSEVVAKFQDLVEENYAKHLEIAEYCDMLGVTIATLNRHVKNELGQTAKQLAQERLALEARVALRTGDRSVKEVAFDLGFGDPLYFSRFFRKQFGAAPTQYFAGTT